MENLNKPEQLHAITSRILQNLKNLQGAPSVQMHPAPPDWVCVSGTSRPEAEDANPDKRTPGLTSDGARKKDHEAEFYDGEKDNERDRGTGDAGKESNDGAEQQKPSADRSEEHKEAGAPTETMEVDVDAVQVEVQDDAEEHEVGEESVGAGEEKVQVEDQDTATPMDI
jgi:hypothetical protein